MNEWITSILYNIENMPGGVKWFFLILAISIYIMGICTSISETTITESKVDSWTPTHLFDPGISVYNSRRNALPKDMWYALWWPLRTGRLVMWVIVVSLHNLLKYPLLLVGFTYANTRMYENINTFIDKSLYR